MTMSSRKITEKKLFNTKYVAYHFPYTWITAQLIWVLAQAENVFNNVCADLKPAAIASHLLQYETPNDIHVVKCKWPNCYVYAI